MREGDDRERAATCFWLPDDGSVTARRWKIWTALGLLAVAAYLWRSLPRPIAAPGSAVSAADINRDLQELGRHNGPGRVGGTALYGLDWQMYHSLGLPARDPARKALQVWASVGWGEETLKPRVAAEWTVRIWLYLLRRQPTEQIDAVITHVRMRYAMDGDTCAYLSRERFTALYRETAGAADPQVVAAISSRLYAGECPYYGWRLSDADRLGSTDLPVLPPHLQPGDVSYLAVKVGDQQRRLIPGRHDREIAALVNALTGVQRAQPRPEEGRMPTDLVIYLGHGDRLYFGQPDGQQVDADYGALPVRLTSVELAQALQAAFRAATTPDADPAHQPRISPRLAARLASLAPGERVPAMVYLHDPVNDLAARRPDLTRDTPGFTYGMASGSYIARLTRDQIEELDRGGLAAWIDLALEPAVSLG